MTNDNIAQLIQQEAKATRLLLKSMHEDNYDLLERFHHQADRHHKEHLETQVLLHKDLKALMQQVHRDNLESQRQFRELLERIVKPGDN